MNFSGSPRTPNFYLDSPVPPKLDLLGARSHFYRPPQTPSAASSLSRVSPNRYQNQTSRKRARYGHDEYDSGYGDASSALDDQATLSLSGLASAAPLVDTRYRLAGGMEAPRARPGAAALANYDDLNNAGNGPEMDYRPSRYTTFQPPEPETPREGNPKKRTRRPSTSESNAPFGGEKFEVASEARRSWGQTVISLVGKVWDFCWSGPFRGFYAGGGKGYDINPGASASPASQNEQSFPVTQATEALCEKSMASASGQFTVDSQDGLRTDWVLIKNDSPSAKLETPSSAARRAPRRGSVIHVASRRAGSRPIVPKRSSISMSARPSSSYRHQHSSSLGSNKPDSPAALEAQRHAAKIRKQEREEDASIRRLNQQLKAMIREGKEALGTRIEVDDIDFDDSE